MSLRSLGSLSRGSMSAWTCCSSSPGIAVEGGLGLKAWVQGDRFRSLRKFYHQVHGHNSPVAAATLPSFAGSRAIHSRAAARIGSSGGGDGGGGGWGGVVLAGGGVLLAVAALTTLSAYIFLRPPEDDDKDLPDHVDWSEMGAVTAVKRQGNCGNCWAHATVGAIEGCYKLETGELVELSVQQLTDCACDGCNGGWLIGAFWYALSGVTTAASYPQRKDLWYGPCCAEGMIPEVKITRFSITSGTEESLMRAVAKQPVAVFLDDHEALQTYTGGIITYEEWPTVDEPKYRHAALVVGYGTDEFGVKFWKLKNSFGPDWGEGGYFRIQRGVPTKFGVAGIRKGLGVYPHMSWFGKKATKGSSVKIAEEDPKGSSVEIAEEFTKESTLSIAEGVANAKASGVKVAEGAAKGLAVKMKTADEGTICGSK